MINELKTRIFYRCIYCGKIESREISIFDFSGDRTLFIECECERFYIKIKRNKKGDFVFSYPCIICNETHLFEINKKLLLKGVDVVFACPVFETELFYSGLEEREKHNAQLLKEQSEVILEVIGYNTFKGVNPYAEKLLKKLDFLNKKGKLNCKCSSHSVYTKVFYDRVELECSSCFLCTVLDASGEEDVDYMADKDSFVLGMDC